MIHTSHPREADLGFPRFFKIGRRWINSYQVFMIVGIYAGSFATAAAAGSSGGSVLRAGMAAAACALCGFVGARLSHLLVHAPNYRNARSWRVLWDSRRGGWSVFGALLTFVPASWAFASLLHLPPAVFWDQLSAGVLAGGFWIRLGCVFNGCCVGRETGGWFGVRLHDTRGERKRRVPVQFMEMAWWLLGGVVWLALWPEAFPEGSYALGVLAWYGVGRFFLEPLRERPALLFGSVRINQVVAGLLAAGAAGVLIVRGY